MFKDDAAAGSPEVAPTHGGTGAGEAAADAAIDARGVTRWYRISRRKKRPGEKDRGGRGAGPSAGGREGEQPDRTIALDNVSLQVPRGELFGLLGPNGAGKTTLIKILSTLLLPSSGTARVLGLDVEQQAHLIRPRINMVSGGEHSGYGILTVRESLWMFGQFYGLTNETTFRRIDEMLEVVGLADAAHMRINQLSTGMRQKMNFVRGFINSPEVLFLDEPTLGLDVQTARTLRGFVKDWIKADPGRTILLTTHYMAEAEELCDRIAIIDDGRILACDSPSGLKRQVQHAAAFRVEVEGLPSAHDLPGPEQFTGIERIAGEAVRATGRHMIHLLAEEDEAVTPFLNVLRDRDVKIIHISKVEPTLEDVFLQLVGRGLRE